LEFSHIAGSAVGVALLILARGLYRRLDGAWWITMTLLAAGILASLLKGIDYEEASLLGLLFLVLGVSRARFYRRSSILEEPFSVEWIASIAVVVGLAVWLAIISYQDVPYEHDLWWQFAFDEDASRVARAVLMSVLVTAGYALWSLLSPAHPDQAPATAEEIERAAEIVARSSDTFANLVLLGDKKLLFDEAGDAFIMFQRSGSSLIAMGDPVGNRQRFPRLAWAFRELCDRAAKRPVFYQASAEMLPLYLDLGMSLAKLGEEARVKLTDFSLEGPKRGDLRNEHRRALRDGASFKVLTPDEVSEHIEELQAISDEWLIEKSTGEKGFSVGRFDRAYVQRFPHACVVRGGKIVAFATLWRTRSKEELSVDLMRYGKNAPRGTMDYLFIELMLWGKHEGYRWFNLGMAPLAGLEKHPMAPFWHKLGIMVRRYGGTFYNFEGLRRYKEKFAPEWRPRYLASPGGLAVPGVALDAAALIAGGIREVISK
jgi:phosphatidylglycerol lysyltransferase